MIKVKGYDNLVKDTHTNAIINIDDVEYRNARLAKENRTSAVLREKQLEDRINKLEGIIQQLLSGYEVECSK